MVEVRGSQWALTGTWGLMAAEELLEDLCHFTAGGYGGDGLSYIQDLNCVFRPARWAHRNVSHMGDAFLLLYRSERELGGGM